MIFKISVIIPVFNAEKYIEKSIQSALQQPEVAEIVVVNDGSTDRTQKILKKLKRQNSIIKIYHHKNNSNQGRSASRNLGIKNAIGNYIAFLDADDFYLPNRFATDKKIFQESIEVDGVYNAIGAHFYDGIELKDKAKLKLFTIKDKIKPENLFDTLLSGNKGYFSIDGLTVKKSVFKTVGYFNEFLEVAEDTDIIWKMTLKCKLEAGIINKPLAIRGVHDANVFYKKELYEIYDLLLYESMYDWSFKNQIDLKIIERFLERIWIVKFKQDQPLYKYIGYWLHLNFKTPQLMFTKLGIKYFPLISMRKKLFPLFYKQKVKL